MNEIFIKLIFPFLFIFIITFGIFLISDNSNFETDQFVLENISTSPFKNPQQITDFANNILSRTTNFFTSFNKNSLTTSSLLDYATKVENEELDESDERQQNENFLESTTQNIEEMEEMEGIGGPVVTPKTPEDLQNILDDIQEKIDIIKYQVEKLIAEKAEKDKLEKENEDKKEEKENIIYPKILILEVKIDPIEQRFIKLFNPNYSQIDLTGWYLQRKTPTSDSFNSLISSTKFNNKVIPANGYFLISRSNGDIIIPDLTLTENNTIILKNPNGEIVSTFVTQSISTSSGAENALTSPNCQKFDNILINELQIEGESVNDDWVELYNPNEQPACLTGWSIQKATKTGNISRIKNFENNAIIPAKSYYLIVDSGANQNLLDLADMTTSSLDLSSEENGGNTIYLVNKKDQILDSQDINIIDKVGYGMAVDFKISPALRPSLGKTIGRIWDEQLGNYKNLGNNSIDFEINEPTPKAKNIKWEDSSSTDPIIDPDPNVVSKILINEIQIFPIEKRFVELYNPNSLDINLTGWYLQRKTKNADSWSSFVSSAHFEGKIIPAEGHFLISRKIIDSDIILDITLSNDNSLVLKNSNREIIDKVGWGEAADFETLPAPNIEDNKSISRTNGIDTDDNSIDFLVFDTPSPEGAIQK